MIRFLVVVCSIVVLVGCASLVRENLSARFGPQQPTRFDVPSSPPSAVPIRQQVSFHQQVLPILEQRCVACHSCYDAPCQLKLDSYEGVTRGASKTNVYDGTRLLAAEPTRLYIDADKPSEWRRKGFFPVLNEFTDRSAAEHQGSLLARSLDLRAQHDLTPNQPAPASLDFSLSRANQCPTIDEYSFFEARNPLMGMPFGLPALSKAEQDTIERWLTQGAPYDKPAPIPVEEERQIAAWEVFFNGSSNRERLVSRYIYEHLFLAHLYFDGGSTPAAVAPRFYRMVRSSTPPGEPIRELTSRRPFDDPHTIFYYRLRSLDETVVAKSHMPYALSEKRMARWKSLFFASDYPVPSLPSYEPHIASNPFKVFEALPINAHYQFMLDEAEFTISGFIKGPVCRGQTALNVVNDHFWIVFRNPDVTDNLYNEYLSTAADLLQLPAEYQSNALVITPWIKYTQQQKQFLEDKSAYLEHRFAAPGAVTMNLIWSGEGNPNAGLTIYRHFDNATVLKGLVGEKPKTAWVINYSLLERIHYLLTAGYDVFGNVGHQINTRLFMNYLRMEGEFNFIFLLPQASRMAVRDHWYRDADESEKEFVYGKHAHFNRETDIPFAGKDRPEHELMDHLRQHLGQSLNTGYDIDQLPNRTLVGDLQRLTDIRGEALRWLPEASLVRVRQGDGSFLILSLVRNTAHLNITRLLTEERAIAPAENSLDVLVGVATAYPNAYFNLNATDIPEFSQRIAALKSAEDFGSLVDRFGVRRTHPDFWAFNDGVMAAYKNDKPIDAGVLDLNRFENH